MSVLNDMRLICEFLESDPVILFNNTLNDIVSKVQAVFSELLQSTEISGIKIKLVPDASRGKADAFDKVENGCKDYLEQMEYYLQYRRPKVVQTKAEFLVKACEKLRAISKDLNSIILNSNSIFTEKEPSKQLAFLYKKQIEPAIINVQQLLAQARNSTTFI